MTTTSVLSTAEALRQARALIADPARWCQDEMARDANGRYADPTSPTARQWCATGAVIHICVATVPALTASRYLRAALGGNRHPEALNDYDGHAAVLEMYDRAIELAEAEEGGS
ncbi:MAG: hypothetical protein LC792_00940 [Actinobacteria bacterium]|nr:hypothetical protein [Actinomycetota bacterium]